MTRSHLIVGLQVYYSASSSLGQMFEMLSERFLQADVNTKLVIEKFTVHKLIKKFIIFFELSYLQEFQADYPVMCGKLSANK